MPDNDTRLRIAGHTALVPFIPKTCRHIVVRNDDRIFSMVAMVSSHVFLPYLLQYDQSSRLFLTSSLTVRAGWAKRLVLVEYGAVFAFVANKRIAEAAFNPRHG